MKDFSKAATIILSLPDYHKKKALNKLE